METMESEKLGDRTMLGTLIETVDPLTGQKLSEIDLSTNANLIVYLRLKCCVIIQDWRLRYNSDCITIYSLLSIKGKETLDSTMQRD